MKRPFLAPECLQLSSMDCGVASVYTLLAGYGVRVSYEALRELCQTGVDGTSIDSLEDLCNGLGVDVIQHVVPRDLAQVVMTGRFPLIAIVARGRGIPHFVTVWRRVGSWLQVMDPAGGRSWVHQDQFAKDLFPHPLRLEVGDWKLWLAQCSFGQALRQRARELLPQGTLDEVVAPALERRSPSEIAALDAALRLLVQVQAANGRTSRAWNDQLFRRAFQRLPRDATLSRELGAIAVEREAICTTGTVLLAPAETGYRRDTLAAPSRDAALAASAERDTPESAQSAAGSESDGLIAQLRRLLAGRERLFAAALVGNALLLSVASTVEILAYRFALDAPRLLSTFGSRLGAALVLGALIFVLVATEVAAAYGGASLGRVLELRCRIQTLEALPRVEDHFVRSRPTTDLAYRAHNLVAVKQLPPSLLAAVRAFADLVVTLFAIGWLGLAFLPPILVGSVLLAASFALTKSRLRELDTRNQVHAARLLTLFLDALRGSRPIRLHGYQNSFRAEQQTELERWRDTGRSLLGTTAALEALNAAVATALLAAVMLVFVATGGDPRLFVLLAFWAFRVPPAVRALVAFAQSYPLQSVALTRLSEITRYVPKTQPKLGRLMPPRAAGASIAFRDVTVVANQVPILRNLTLDVAPGEHIAIVGRSGSGKSSLLGLLLGFWKPTSGALLLDGEPYDQRRRGELLASTVWVDPSAQLWDATIRDNVDYSVAGTRASAGEQAVQGVTRRPLVETAELSDLFDVIDRMDKGFDTRVGPEGSLISGGEGQRVRLARGLRRADVRMVALDEAFRGLDRATRKRLTNNVRTALRHSTLLSVSHDIDAALDFPRVLVVEDGRVVEDGNPQELAARGSRFAELLEAEARAGRELWADSNWRRLRVAAGGIVDERVVARV